LTGLRLTYLQSGDRFDPGRGIALVRSDKKPTETGTQDYRDNFLIADIHAPAAVPWAVCFGLAENTSRRQGGVTLRYNQRFGHGYRFTFTKTDETKTFAGYVDHVYSYAVVDLQLEVAPILADLQPPETNLPVDLSDGPARTALTALWFRGILLADDQRRLRPTEPITRAELATALAQSLHLKPPRAAIPIIDDADPSSEVADELPAVVVAGLMAADSDGRFRPRDAATRDEAAMALVGLAKLSGLDLPRASSPTLVDEGDVAAPHREAVYAAVGAGLLRLEGDRFRPAAAWTRQEAATALCQLIAFGWADTAAAGDK
jgi:hypothetical protein